MDYRKQHTADILINKMNSFHIVKNANILVLFLHRHLKITLTFNNKSLNHAAHLLQ